MSPYTGKCLLEAFALQVELHCWPMLSTKDALEQHIFRAMLQSCIWSKSTPLKEQSIAMTDWGWDVNPLWTTLLKASKPCKELKNCKFKNFCSCDTCTCKTYAIPYSALCRCDGVARTDITSSMMRFVERGNSETYFSFDCTYINRPVYILGTFLLAMNAFCEILYAFFKPISLPVYNFHRYFCETNFLWNNLRATFNPGFGYIQLLTPMILFNSLDEDFECLFSTYIPIIWQ